MTPTAGPDRELDVLTGFAAAVGAASAVVALRGAASPDAFGDGAAYRRMARGEPGAPPFHRRVVGPWLARLLGGGDAGFRRVALLGVAAGAVGTGLLADRVARECGAPRERARRAGVLTAALVPTLPHSLRMAVQMPPFNDQLAVAAGAAWLLLARRERPVAPAGALLAALTREQWAGVVATALPVLTRDRRTLLAHAAAVAAAAATILTRPAGPGSEIYPVGVSLRRFVTADGLAELAWAVGGTLGPLPALLPGAVRDRAGSPTLRALLRVVAVQTALGLGGGSDSPRLLHGGLPFLLAATVGAGVAREDRAVGPVVAAALAVWRPLARPAPSAAGYERFHLPYMHGLLRRRALDAAARVAAGAAAALAARRRLSGR